MLVRMLRYQIAWKSAVILALDYFKGFRFAF